MGGRRSRQNSCRLMLKRKNQRRRRRRWQGWVLRRRHLGLGLPRLFPRPLLLLRPRPLRACDIAIMHTRLQLQAKMCLLSAKSPWEQVASVRPRGGKSGVGRIEGVYVSVFQYSVKQRLGPSGPQRVPNHMSGTILCVVVRVIKAIKYPATRGGQRCAAPSAAGQNRRLESQETCTRFVAAVRGYG